mmetsp:Transcript_124681/g.398611  ORF Transcript_124681/g.398611 Transcript_124681/m.398611 type:complete len:357 (+) Transcript_124681:274-1344(+)
MVTSQRCRSEGHLCTCLPNCFVQKAKTRNIAHDCTTSVLAAPTEVRKTSRTILYCRWLSDTTATGHEGAVLVDECVLGTARVVALGHWHQVRDVREGAHARCLQSVQQPREFASAMLTVTRLAASHVHLQQQLVHLGHGTGLHGLRQGCPLRALDVHLQDRQRFVALLLHDVRQCHNVDALLVVPEHALAVVIRSLCREPDLHEVQGRRPRWLLAIRGLRLHQLPELFRGRGGIEDPNLAVRGEAQHGDLEGRVPAHAEGVNDAALLSTQLLRIAHSLGLQGEALIPSRGTHTTHMQWPMAAIGRRVDVPDRGRVPCRRRVHRHQRIPSVCGPFWSPFLHELPAQRHPGIMVSFLG